MYQLTLTREHLQIIFTALGELPFKTAVAVVEAISQQIQAQESPEAGGEAVKRQ